jgi:hypothetical protein
MARVPPAGKHVPDQHALGQRYQASCKLYPGPGESSTGGKLAFLSFRSFLASCHSEKIKKQHEE